MNNLKEKIVWVLTLAFVWMLISIYWYVCSIRGFCQTENQEISVEKNVPVEIKNTQPAKTIVLTDTQTERVESKTTKKIIKCYTYLNSYINLNSNKNINSEVKKLEEFFNKYYSKNLIVDGVYSVEDVAAVKEFQEKNNLEADGAVGYETQRMINGVYCVKTQKNIKKNN